MILWRDIMIEPAPRDGPVGLLSIRMQHDGAPVGMIDCFDLGYNFKSGIGYGFVTHWCEVEELILPL